MGLKAPAAPAPAPPLPPPTAADPSMRAEAFERRASTFAAATRLLAPAIRDDVAELYSMFRSLDDLVDDGSPDAATRVSAVANWAACGRPRRTPEVATLERMSSRVALPRDAVGDFCAGMEQDLAGAHFATERELDRYCYQVAGTVGLVMMSLLGSVNRTEARASAIALGMAMQRTNILRDIDEDLALGRVYISDEARAIHGWSLAPGRRGELVRAQIARADELYEDGLLGLRCLRSGRPAIALAAGMYREILREIERQGLGRTPGRAVVPGGRKVLTALRVTLVGR